MNPQTLKPSSPQALKPSSPQALKKKFNLKILYLILLGVFIFFSGCQKDNSISGNYKSGLGEYNSSFSHESVAKILSVVLNDLDGQEIYLNTLKQTITSQTDTTISGIYSVPLLFLINKMSNNQKKFYQIWDSIAVSIDTACTVNFLITEYIPSFPGMGVSVFDPQERLEKNLNALDQDFELALKDSYETDTLYSYKNGSFEKTLVISDDPEVMTLILQENEGYWMLTSNQISSDSAFFAATGTSICADAVNNIDSLNLNPLKGTSSFQLGNSNYSNPLYGYNLISVQDVANRFNNKCYQGTEAQFDQNGSSGYRENTQAIEGCERDDLSMRERIIRFRFQSPGAKSLLSNQYCNWPSKMCRFKIIAFIPTANDLKTAYYVDAPEKIFIALRTWLGKGGWCYTNELGFGSWQYLEGKMGEYWKYTFIQLNKFAGLERTMNANAKITGGVKFSIPIDGINVETTLNGEGGIGISVKYTEKDWELGDDIVEYCDCQSCNSWQGETYSPGTFLFSIRECSNLPSCN